MFIFKTNNKTYLVIKYKQIKILLKYIKISYSQNKNKN